MPANVYLIDSTSESWLLGVTNPPVDYTLTAASGAGVTSILLVDTATSAIWALSIAIDGLGQRALFLTAASGSAIANIPVAAPNGTLYGIAVTNGAIAIVSLSSGPVQVVWAPVGYNGRGSKLMYSPDSVTYTPLGQMQSFEHSGSKQTMVDQTNILSPSNATQALAVRVDHGEIDIAALLDPQNPTYLALQQFHIGNTLVYWKVRLIDGSSFTFTAFVSEFKAFGVKLYKLNVWSAKLRLSGPIVPVLL